MPDEVIARRDVLWEGERVGLSIHYVRRASEPKAFAIPSQRMSILTDILLNPSRTIALLADLVDLEPLCIRRVELVARRTLARGHVREHRPGVVRPLPKDTYISSWSSRLDMQARKH